MLYQKLQVGRFFTNRACSQTVGEVGKIKTNLPSNRTVRHILHHKMLLKRACDTQSFCYVAICRSRKHKFFTAEYSGCRSQKYNKKIGYRRGTARLAVPVEILSATAELRKISSEKTLNRCVTLKVTPGHHRKSFDSTGHVSLTSY